MRRMEFSVKDRPDNEEDLTDFQKRVIVLKDSAILKVILPFFILLLTTIKQLLSADSDEEEEIPTRSTRPSRATRSQKFFESDDEDDPETSDFEP